jgi:pyruvate/2-oxoglutarate/acetoin dehydrogenase E1 component
MTYVESINRAIRERIAFAERLVCFGQNITAGSCLSGLTRDLRSGGSIELIDTPSCENALVALGLGMMLEGVDSIFFVKQLDFLLLACDQLVNTYNLTRTRGASGSFTIVPIVVDSGFEGPQSRLNNLADMCSLADLPGFALAEPSAARSIVDRHLISPGLRILALSQRLFRAVNEPGSAVPIDASCAVFQLERGTAATIVAFNFAWPQARALHRALAADGVDASLFGVAACDPPDWGAIIDSVALTGRLVLVDDSRSRNRPADRLCALLAGRMIPCAALPLYRGIHAADLRPHADVFEVDAAVVLEWLRKTEPNRGRIIHG